MFAMLYMTAADAAIATWNGKARWLFWRPITAIREAAADGNPDTAADTDVAAADQHAAVPRPAVRPVVAGRGDGGVARAGVRPPRAVQR